MLTFLWSIFYGLNVNFVHDCGKKLIVLVNFSEKSTYGTCQKKKVRLARYTSGLQHLVIQMATKTIYLR
jgi:hypothetical protein